MNMDSRTKTKFRPMFGCNSDLDYATKREPFDCGFETREKEKACEGCSRRNTEQKGVAK
jgi:hypothetical protein